MAGETRVVVCELIRQPTVWHEARRPRVVGKAARGERRSHQLRSGCREEPQSRIRPVPARHVREPSDAIDQVAASDAPHVDEPKRAILAAGALPRGEVIEIYATRHHEYGCVVLPHPVE